ncbi:hypothetical protein HMPREF1609_02135 [Escherichia coli 908541]|nr:hypothetical protein HMPREF1609_02135 [Escherichia coli 908541]
MVGAALTLLHRLFWKARYASASGLFCVRLSIKMQLLQHGVSSFESISQG